MENVWNMIWSCCAVYSREVFEAGNIATLFQLMSQIELLENTENCTDEGGRKIIG